MFYFLFEFILGGLFMKKNRIDFKEKRRYAIKKVSGKTEVTPKS